MVMPCPKEELRRQIGGRSLRGADDSFDHASDGSRLVFASQSHDLGNVDDLLKGHVGLVPISGVELGLLPLSVAVDGTTELLEDLGGSLREDLDGVLSGRIRQILGSAVTCP